MSVVYLTGLSGIGKTSLSEKLVQKVNPIRIYRYSEAIREYFQKHKNISYSTEQLRSLTCKDISQKDITIIDRILVDQVLRLRTSVNVIIESHAVNVNEHGIRITPFLHDTLKELPCDLVVMLYLDTKELYERLSKDTENRKKLTTEQIEVCHALQSALAIQYAMLFGVEVIFLNAKNDIDTNADCIVEYIQGF